MWISELQQELSHRLLDIWQGKSGLPPAQEDEYRELWLTQAEDRIIEKTRGKTLLCDSRLRNLIRLVRSVAHLPGEMAELGTYKGGSAKAIGLANPDKQLHTFDNWNFGIPEDCKAGGHKKGDFASPFMECQSFLSDCNVVFHPGVFPRSVRGDREYCFVHLDADTLQSTKAGIDYFYPRLVPGGVLVFDDYGWEHCPGVKPLADNLPEEIHDNGNHQAYIVKGSASSKRKKLLLKLNLCPGDSVVLTGLVESLHRQYPNQYLTDVDCTWKNDLFRYNPRITTLKRDECQIIECRHDAINELSKRDVSFVQAMCEHVGREIGKPLVPQVTRPHLYLNKDEDKVPPALGQEPFILLNAGRKQDYPLKNPSPQIWQSVVDALKHRVRFIQIGEASPGHTHPPIDGAINWIGKTTPRELVRLAKFAVAGVGPISVLCHLCAAWDVPYVCFVGGREESGWASWNTTRWLGTIGSLPCCQSKGCWKSRIGEVEEGTKRNGSYCELPVFQGGDWVPKCHQILGHESVIAALLAILNGKGI